MGDPLLSEWRADRVAAGEAAGTVEAGPWRLWLHRRARTPVILLVHDLNVRIINATTGELLRELTIDPRRDYQPTKRPPGPHRTRK